MILLHMKARLKEMCLRIMNFEGTFTILKLKKSKFDVKKISSAARV